jgi:hypothetical protein
MVKTYFDPSLSPKKTLGFGDKKSQFFVTKTRFYEKDKNKKCLNHFFGFNTLF